MPYGSLHIQYAHLGIHRHHREWYTDIKLSGIIKEYSSSTIPPSFQSRFYESLKLKN